jgi:transposase
MVERSFHPSGVGIIDEGMQPYPMELRQRVWQALQEGASSLEAAERFGINDSCVRKWRARANQTGSLQPAARTQGRKREFDARHDAALVKAVRSKPDAIGRELAKTVGQRLGRVFSESVISRALVRLGFSRKKNAKRQRAAARRRTSRTRKLG